VLDVRATFEGGAQRGAIALPQAVRSLVVKEGDRERSPEGLGRSWSLGCASTCTVRYAIDLSGAAELTDDAPTVATRSGGDVVALGSTWLLRPEPVDARAPVTLRVDTRDPASPAAEPFRFAAPFPRDGASGAYRLVARDLGALGYTAFGRFTELSVKATKGTVDVVVLRGPRAASDDTIAGWVDAMARAMDTVYGRFPIDRAMVAVVPTLGADEVEFGRTVPAGGASIIVYVGERAGRAELFDDWVLAHELFHLGVPSMPRDGTWIDEGLATYYEPILRTRAGLRPARATWAEFRRTMPRGVATPDEPRLVATAEHDRVYFGGSLFALTADVEIRRRTAGARSLDDGLRRALAEGGKATEVWRVEDFVAALDRGAGARVVAGLFERAARPPAPCGPAIARGELLDPSACAPDDVVSLLRLFDALGVRAGTAELVELDDAAPLAAVRRDIGLLDPAIAAAVARDAPRGSTVAGSARATAREERP
jgi:hypothetical protein